MVETDFKYLKKETIKEGFCEDEQVDFEIAYQLKRIADALWRSSI